MSYTSDVRICVSTNGFKVLNDYVKNHTEYNIIDNAIILNGKDQVCFGWNSICWKEKYPEIEAVEDGIDYLQRNDYSYIYSKFGEKFDDQIECNYESVQREKNITLYYPEHLREFDDKATALNLMACTEKENDIRTLLKLFEKYDVYELETALAIHEFADKDYLNITDKEINKCYDIIQKEDDVITDYVKEAVYVVGNEITENKELDNSEMEM